MESPATSGVRQYLPILEWLPRYQAAWLRFDLVAALTVWALIVPQAIAYAQIAGLAPETGLFAAAAGLTGYAILGTARQLLVSPTSSTAAISASLVAAIALNDPAQSAHLSSALAIIVGIVFVVLGLAKVGFISQFIPTSVQVGFMFGLGMTIIIGQATKILGIPGTEGSFVAQLEAFLGELGGINLASLAVGTTALAALLVGRRVSPALPMALIVVLGGIAAVAIFGLAERGVEVIGTLPSAFPLPALPMVGASDLLALVPGAIAISIIGSAESLTVARQFAEEHREEIRPDQELIANGGANVLAGLFQGFIVGGGASQSAANDRAGARSQLVSLIVGGLTVLTSVALLPLFRDLPQAVLGAIVISAVIGFLRVGELRRILRLRSDSFFLALLTLVATLVLGILSGLILATILALLLLLVRLARESVTILGRAPNGDAWLSVDRNPATSQLPGLLVIRADAPVLFLNVTLVRDQIRAAARSHGSETRVVIVDLSSTVDLDVESLDTVRRLAEEIRSLGAELWLASVRGRVRDMFQRAGVDATTGDPRLFLSLNDAIVAYESRGGSS